MLQSYNSSSMFLLDFWLLQISPIWASPNFCSSRRRWSRWSSGKLAVSVSMVSSFQSFIFSSAFPFSSSFFMHFISFFLCVFCSHQLVPSLPWCCVCSSIFQKTSATLRYRSTYCIIWGALMRFVFPTIWSVRDYWSISPYTPFGRGGGSAIQSRRT